MKYIFDIYELTWRQVSMYVGIKVRYLVKIMNILIGQNGQNGQNNFEVVLNP